MSNYDLPAYDYDDDAILDDAPSTYEPRGQLRVPGLRQRRTDPMLVITVANIKGGSGKTSAAVPLAYAGMARGLQVMLLDLDPNPSATRWFNSANLASERFGAYTIGVESLDGALKAAAGARVDIVVIDTPPVLEAVVMEAMGCADVVLIPMHTGIGDVDNLPATVRLLKLPVAANPHLMVTAVLNHTGRMTAITRRTREAVEAFGVTVAETEIPFLGIYAEAKSQTPTGQEYPRLLQELMDMARFTPDSETDEDDI